MSSMTASASFWHSRPSASTVSLPAAFKSARQMEWKVPVWIRPAALRFGISLRRRSFSSPAAWFVKVTAVISDGFTRRSSVRQRILAARVPVFPVPGPAITATARAVCSAARRCPSLRRARKSASRIFPSMPSAPARNWCHGSFLPAPGPRYHRPLSCLPFCHQKPGTLLPRLQRSRPWSSVHRGFPARPAGTAGSFRTPRQSPEAV